MKGITTRPHDPLRFQTANEGQIHAIDYLSFIDRILKNFDNLILRENSILYSLAVEQYNQNLKGTTVRPPVPNWFCGKINPDTGELIDTPEARQKDLTPTYTWVRVATPNEGQVGAPISYEVDPCLALGPPGSVGYLSCQVTRDQQSTYLVILDNWPAYFAIATNAIHPRTWEEWLLKWLVEYWTIGHPSQDQSQPEYPRGPFGQQGSILPAIVEGLQAVGLDSEGPGPSEPIKVKTYEVNASNVYNFVTSPLSSPAKLTGADGQIIYFTYTEEGVTNKLIVQDTTAYAVLRQAFGF